MPKACSICVHARRAEVDKWLDALRPASEIAREIGVPENRIHRHRGHIEKKKTLELSPVLGNSELGKLLGLARDEYTKAKDPKVRLLALARMQSLQADLARLAQEQSTDPQSWAAHPANASILDGIMGTLEAYPDAMQAVLAYMRETIGTTLRSPAPAASSPHEGPPPGGVPAPREEGAGAEIPLSDL